MSKKDSLFAPLIEAKEKARHTSINLSTLDYDPLKNAAEMYFKGIEDAKMAELERAVVEAACDFWEFGTELYQLKLDAAVDKLLAERKTINE